MVSPCITECLSIDDPEEYITDHPDLAVILNGKKIWCDFKSVLV
jgi:hypothetical protein